MRIALLALFATLASSALGACSSDGTEVNMPRGSDGLLGGSGAPDLPSKAAQSADAGGSEVSDAAVYGAIDAATLLAPAPVGPSDAGDWDAEVTTRADASATPGVAGCTCGCADPCLTELIADCKAPTLELALVCPKVPATCTCETSCAGPPAEPSLTQCIAQFLLSGG